MLEAVVEQMELRPELLLGEYAGSVAGFSDDDRNTQTPRHQQGFVAEIMRRTCGIDQSHALSLASVTAREDIELHSSRFQQLSQQQHKRRLARSTDGEISDAHHRPAEPLGASQAAVIERVPRANPEPESELSGFIQFFGHSNHMLGTGRQDPPLHGL